MRLAVHLKLLITLIISVAVGIAVNVTEASEVDCQAIETQIQESLKDPVAVQSSQRLLELLNELSTQWAGVARTPRLEAKGPQNYLQPEAARAYWDRQGPCAPIASFDVFKRLGQRTKTLTAHQQTSLRELGIALSRSLIESATTDTQSILGLAVLKTLQNSKILKLTPGAATELRHLYSEAIHAHQFLSSQVYNAKEKGNPTIHRHLENLIVMYESQRLADRVRGYLAALP